MFANIAFLVAMIALVYYNIRTRNNLHRLEMWMKAAESLNTAIFLSIDKAIKDIHNRLPEDMRPTEEELKAIAQQAFEETVKVFGKKIEKISQQ